MHSTQVTGGIIALVILLASLASLAIRKEALIGRGVDGHPDFAGRPVDAIRVATQFMFTSKPVRIVITGRTFQSEYSSRYHLGPCRGRA